MWGHTNMWDLKREDEFTLKSKEVSEDLLGHCKHPLN